MSRAWLDLGTNLEREKSLRRALELLAQHFTIQRTSHVYETPPVGFEDQPNFYNLCVEVETRLGEDEVRERLRRLEDEMGRVRTENKNGPRNIDIDLLIYEGSSHVHPQVERELFVLLPLCELIPEWVHPGRREKLGDLLATFSGREGGIQKVKLLGLPLDVHKDD